MTVLCGAELALRGTKVKCQLMAASWSMAGGLPSPNNMGNLGEMAGQGRQPMGWGGVNGISLGVLLNTMVKAAGSEEHSHNSCLQQCNTVNTVA